jgi:hypothetical protein
MKQRNSNKSQGNVVPLKQNNNNTNKVKVIRVKTNPMVYRELSVGQAIQELNLYRTLMRSKYLYAMIHPDVAVSQGFQVKMYSDIPLPTASIGFKVVKQFSTSMHGTFALTWSPNMFATDMGLVRAIPTKPGNQFTDPNDFAYSNITYNNDDDLTGLGANENFNYVPTYVPSVDVQKYRLVSALLKVRYNGSVMNQAGSMHSCATMQPATNVILAVDTSRVRDKQLNNAETLISEIVSVDKQQYGDFDLIRNGMWNFTQNITADARGVECLYVPIDPTAHIFYDNATSYGDHGTADWSNVDVPAAAGGTTAQTRTTVILQPQQGTQLTYVVCGMNLPVESKCIQMEVFYNFEVIPTPRTAPVLRSSMETILDSRDAQRMNEAWRHLVDNQLLIRTETPPKPYTYQGSLRKWGPNLTNLVSKLV